MGRARWIAPLLAAVVLPLLGAAGVIFVLEREGGDLSGWPLWQAIAVPAALFAVPALLSLFAARRLGLVEAVAWVLVCLAVQFALVVGVGFLLLGYGPGDKGS
jgi:hypothetical protein